MYVYMDVYVCGYQCELLTDIEANVQLITNSRHESTIQMDKLTSSDNKNNNASRVYPIMAQWHH